MPNFQDRVKSGCFIPIRWWLDPCSLMLLTSTRSPLTLYLVHPSVDFYLAIANGVVFTSHVKRGPTGFLINSSNLFNQVDFWCFIHAFGHWIGGQCGLLRLSRPWMKPSFIGFLYWPISMLEYYGPRPTCTISILAHFNVGWLWA